MAAPSPDQLAHSFAAALARRDLDAALAMWGEDAAILTREGTELRGREQIRHALAALLDNGARVEVEVRQLHLAGDVALATGALTLSGEGPAGSYRHRSESTVVYARGRDGLWRIALDAPWGLPGAAPGANGA